MPFDARLLSGVSILSAVVEAGSFVRAAELLNMTASGVSHGIARLEARVEAHACFIERPGRSTSPTKVGGSMRGSRRS